MEKFDTIFHRAANRHGGEEALRIKVANRYVGSNVNIDASPKSDDRWLSEFSKRIFKRDLIGL